jgi:hypothetical protein
MVPQDLVWSYTVLLLHVHVAAIEPQWARIHSILQNSTPKAHHDSLLVLAYDARSYYVDDQMPEDRV